MSDVDREAERERLREKYEQERAEREVTQQMSELLLRGATMTNKHCETCSNPIFRYEGDEFCPVCQGQVEDPQDDADGAAAAGAEATERSSPDAGPGAAGRSSPGDGGAVDADESTADAAESDAGDVPDHVDDSPAAPVTGAADRAAPARTGATDAGADTGAPGDLAEARDALVRTLADSARRAEGATDARRRRDLLAAAREAAEALEALDRASR